MNNEERPKMGCISGRKEVPRQEARLNQELMPYWRLAEPCAIEARSRPVQMYHQIADLKDVDGCQTADELLASQVIGERRPSPASHRRSPDDDGA